MDMLILVIQALQRMKQAGGIYHQERLIFQLMALSNGMAAGGM